MIKKTYLSIFFCTKHNLTGYRHLLWTKHAIHVFDRKIQLILNRRIFTYYYTLLQLFLVVNSNESCLKHKNRKGIGFNIYLSVRAEVLAVRPLWHINKLQVVFTKFFRRNWCARLLSTTTKNVFAMTKNEHDKYISHVYIDIAHVNVIYLLVKTI